MRYVIDIETPGLISDMCNFKEFPYRLKEGMKIWVISIRNIDTKEKWLLTNNEITSTRLKEILHDCTELIAHNGLKFDFPVLQLFGLIEYEIGFIGKPSFLYGKECKFTDTLVWSRLFYPDRFGGHSLYSWGERLGLSKIDYRKLLITNGKLDAHSEKGAEFQQYFSEMAEYCETDTEVGELVYKELLEESKKECWKQAIEQESILAHLSVFREHFGFGFDKGLALNNLEELGELMTDIAEKINPILPPRKLNKTEQKNFILPKKQLDIKGNPTKNMMNFAEKHGSEVKLGESGWELHYKDRIIPLPYNEAIETEIAADIDNLDHVKMYLISLGWIPTEWRERDLTKDSKKQNLSPEKRLAALNRWWEETQAGKYTEQRYAYFDVEPDEIYLTLKSQLNGKKPVKIPTSPMIRVGVTKDLCPHLISLGEKVEFAKDFADYLTYKHRKSCIAGGDVEEMDFDEESPNTGYLANYREEDQRIPTPAIEIGAGTYRYKHIGVANVPRVTSLYGENMRGLFTPGKGFIQFGWDYASLEARIMGNYVYKYTDGPEMAEMLLAEKPNDWHSKTAEKIGIDRTPTKSLNYGLIYGSQPAKVAKMLNCNLAKAKEIYTNAWNAMPSLKELKVAVENFWESTGKKYIIGIDGRKIFTRSKHSLLNFLFQSAGVICTKYVFVNLFEKFVNLGYNINPFKGKPDVISMIEYHDECQFATKNFYKYKIFKTEQEAKDFVASWDGEQLSAIGHNKEWWYVALPNVISRAINESLAEVTKKFELKVALSMEFALGRSWRDCH